MRVILGCPFPLTPALSLRERVKLYRIFKNLYVFALYPAPVSRSL